MLTNYTYTSNVFFVNLLTVNWAVVGYYSTSSGKKLPLLAA